MIKTKKQKNYDKDETNDGYRKTRLVYNKNMLRNLKNKHYRYRDIIKSSQDKIGVELKI